MMIQTKFNFTYKFVLILSLVVFSFGSIFSEISMSANADVICKDTGCSISGKIFDNSNLSPTDEFERTLKVKNEYFDEREFAVEIKNAGFNDSSPSLSEVLNISISDGGGPVFYGPKPFKQWKDDGFVKLGKIGTGETKEYKFKVTLNNVGNTYQGKKLTFDIDLGFEAGATSVGEVAGISVTPTLTPRAQSVLGVTSAEEGDVASGVSDSREENGITGDVLGSTCEEPRFPWWLPLLAQLGLTIFFYVIISNLGVSSHLTIIPPLALSFLSQKTHDILGCSCATVFWCEYYWVLNIAILLMPSLQFKIKKGLNGSN